jgi:FemAB-related protein (PEP-CTERM system-associated)
VDVGDPVFAGDWDAYVRNHSQGSVFHTAAWQRLIQTSFGHKPTHLAAQKQGSDAIIGLLPLFLVHSLIFGRMLVSTPQAAYGGILADSDSIANAIMVQARQIAIQNKVQFFELRNFRNALTLSDLVPKNLYVTFRQELHPDIETNLLSIPRKTRAEIREGIRNGLEFGIGRIGVDQFFHIYSQSVRELGTPVFAKRLFANGLYEFGSDCRIASVHWQGKLVAAVWTLFFKDEVLPYYGGSIREFNHLAVNNFMYWMLLKYACENGYRIFDFGRSKKGTGSFSFKKRWGMHMSDLPYQYLLVRRKSLPDTSPMNPEFALAIRLWRSLPLSVTNSLGSMISKHLI